MLTLLLSAIVCAALIGAVQLRLYTDSVAAVKEGAGFTPPPLSSASPGQASTDLIAVVGDEWAAPRNTIENRPWPYLLQRAIGVRVRAFASDGGAYAASAVGAGGASFSAGAGAIPPTTSIVVFFGGARDEIDPPADLAASATQALADAAERAPNARLIVVAPVPTRPGRTAQIAQVRSVLRTVAQAARAEYVDPVAQKWLVDESLWSVDDPSPSAAGNRRLSDRMAAVLTPLLTKATS